MIWEQRMKELRENGYVRWKGFFVTLGGIMFTMGGFIFSMFLYLDSKIVTKDQFNEFKHHIMFVLTDIKKELDKK